MNLLDYSVNRDKFEYYEDVDNFLAFPCCVCIHRVNADTEEPCRTCDHNINAVEEPCD